MHERKYKISENRLVKRGNSVPVPQDEPLFILRAKDRKALAALVSYHAILDNLSQKEAVMLTINDFRAFQEGHPELMGEPAP